MKHLLRLFVLTAVLLVGLFGVLRAHAAVGPRTLDPAMPQPSIEASKGVTVTLHQWQSISLPAGVEIYMVRRVAVMPDDANTLLLASWRALYRSEDAARTWTAVITDALPYGPSYVQFSYNNRTQAYALGSGILMRSEDYGLTWTHSMTVPADLCNLTLTASDAQRLYGHACDMYNYVKGFYRSDDGGETWFSPASALTTAIQAFAVSLTDANQLVATSGGYIVRSSDGGVTWTRLQGYPPVRFLRIITDYKNLGVLYANTDTNLWRSLDSGATWQEMSAETESFITVVSPLIQGQLYGVGETGAILSSTDKEWSIQDWELPEEIWNIWSNRNELILYAAGETALWRYGPTTQAWPDGLMLPFIAAPDPRREQTPNAAAIQRANWYRSVAGLAPLVSDPTIVVAANNHSTYYLLNADNPAAWLNGPHGEVDGYPGFTGTSPLARMVAAGFKGYGSSEVIAYVQNEIAAVDAWMATVYHRFPFLNVRLQTAGYGSGYSASRRINVMDFGYSKNNRGYWYDARPYLIAYPVDGQTNVPPAWNGLENPNPLPPGAARPVGYPFTLLPKGGALDVDFIELRSSAGDVIPVHPNPADCETRCYALTPVKPLAPKTQYVVTARGSVADVPFDRQWTFTTGNLAVTSAADVAEIVIGPPWENEIDTRGYGKEPAP